MDSVGSFQSASLSADSEFGGNKWSKHTDKLQCFIRVVRVFRGSKELFRLRACLKTERGCVEDQPQHAATNPKPMKVATRCGWSRMIQPRSGIFRQALQALISSATKNTDPHPTLITPGIHA